MDEEIRVLFVDDEPNVLNAIRRNFFDEDLTFFYASSGESGLELLGKHHIQIVVSDYRMPGMNGIHFLSEVNKRWPETVRIVLSGYADIEAIIGAVNEGQIYKFIPKPWNDDDLKVTISNAIERYVLYKKNSELTDELSEKNERLMALNAELKRLVEEKTANLEFRSQILSSYQNILDALPAGIVGIDSARTIALCNSAFVGLAGRYGCVPGESVDGCLPEDLTDFLGEIGRFGSAKKRFMVGGVPGILSGVRMDVGGSQKGIILLFVREDDLS